MNIVFVCTGNTCRSPMAEVILKDLCQKNNLTDVECSSAGLSAFTGDSASEEAVEAVKELGLDLTGHRARQMNAFLLRQTDLFVPMTPMHAAALRAMGVGEDRLFLPQPPVPDPYGGSLEEYRRCRDSLVKLCQQLLERGTHAEK